MPQDAQPVLVHAIQLPPLAGFMSPKPVVAADPVGNVLVVAHGLTNAPLGSDILVWRSIDRGNTWSLPENLTDLAKDGEIFFDPWLETDRRGHFYFVHALVSDGRPHVRRSKDAGFTWSNTLPIKWKWCDRPVLSVSPNGRRLAVAGAMTEKTDNYPSEPLDSNDPDFVRKVRAAFRNYAGIFVSRNYGESWRKVTGPFDDEHAIPFSIVIDDAGRMAASWIVEGDGSRSVVIVTENLDRTWTTTTLVESLQPDRQHPFNGARFSVLALDGRSVLHVAYV
ncbi:MAG: exo-alpha-sialidase, partial [Planctomycetes bacterium]|nr:exo-alpha-sialidase [Planctomycetota bacterium]